MTAIPPVPYAVDMAQIVDIKPLRVQRYNKFCTYANIFAFSPKISAMLAQSVTFFSLYSGLTPSAVQKNLGFYLRISKKSSTFAAVLRLKQAEDDTNRDMNEFLETEEAILKMLKTVFDPEIPVNIYDLGLIYGIDVKPDGVCDITMTLTAPSCPAGDFLVEDIRQKVGSVEGIKEVNVNIVFEPEWNKDMMSEEAKLELGFL